MSISVSALFFLKPPLFILLLLAVSFVLSLSPLYPFSSSHLAVLKIHSPPPPPPYQTPVFLHLHRRYVLVVEVVVVEVEVEVVVVGGDISTRTLPFHLPGRGVES